MSTPAETIQLPFVDEHITVVNAGAADVWRALVEIMGSAFSGDAATAYARAVGSDDVGDSGPRPLAVGSTIPGFHVTSAIPERELVLVGRHKFSTYELTFRLDADSPGGTRLRAETRAEFPGVAGRAYRLLVIGSRFHAIAVRRLLAGIRRGAERYVPSPPAT